MIAELQSLALPAIAAILVAGIAAALLAMNRRQYSARLARRWRLDPRTVRVVAADGR